MRNKLEAWLLAILGAALYLSVLAMTWLAVYWSGFAGSAIFAGIALSALWSAGAMGIAVVVGGSKKRDYPPGDNGWGK